MNKFRPGLILILVCCVLFSAEIICGPNSEMYPAVPTDGTINPLTDKMTNILGNSYVPRDAAKVLQTSHEKYLEGCELFQAGESEKAQDYFNEAVDLLLSSNWDGTSTLHLNYFFQELIKKIPMERTSDSLKHEDSGPIQLRISPSLKDETIVQLIGTGYEIPITVNKTVAKSIYYWLNDGRKFFVEGLRRSGQYRSKIERIFREESVPLDLMYLAQVESFFKPAACSSMGAKGIWQFNEGTAIQYGLKVTPDIDERSDPEKSTRAAARYLKDLYATFGDWNLVLAAYNWGGGRVRRVIQETGRNDFWELVESGQRFPNETRNHVPLVHASIILARNPEKFDLQVELDPPIEYIEVSVSKPISLRAAAKVLKTTVDELKQMNPSLRELRTPAEYPDFRLKVPADSDVNLRERLVTLSLMIEPTLEQVERHSKIQGDNPVHLAYRD